MVFSEPAGNKLILAETVEYGKQWSSTWQYLKQWSSTGVSSGSDGKQCLSGLARAGNSAYCRVDLVETVPRPLLLPHRLMRVL